MLPIICIEWTSEVKEPQWAELRTPGNYPVLRVPENFPKIPRERNLWDEALRTPRAPEAEDALEKRQRIMAIFPPVVEP